MRTESHANHREPCSHKRGFEPRNRERRKRIRVERLTQTNPNQTNPTQPNPNQTNPTQPNPKLTPKPIIKNKIHYFLLFLKRQRMTSNHILNNPIQDINIIIIIKIHIQIIIPMKNNIVQINKQRQRLIKFRI